MQRISIHLFLLIAALPSCRHGGQDGSKAGRALRASTGHVLIVGDSLTCGSFGERLYQLLNTRQFKSVTLYCAVSSAPAHWLRGITPRGQICQTKTTPDTVLSPCPEDGQVPRVQGIFRERRWGKIIIALGTNTVADGSADATYGEIALLAADAAEECAWIGPPHFRPDQARGFPAGRVETMERKLGDFYGSLRRRVGESCANLFIDSQSATAPGTPGSETTDGVHRTKSSGPIWADEIVDLI